VQEAYQQIIYERQHPYASAGSSSSGGYSNTGGNSYANGGYAGNGYNGQFYTNWDDFFNDFFTGAFTGQYQYSNQQMAPESDYDRYMKAAANYINNRRYKEAINVLNSVEDHSSLWYYYSAIAHAGLGNHAQALEYATIAADMEPSNYSYQNLVTQLRHGRGGYQERQNTYVRSYDTGGWCLRLCLMNMFLNLFCGGSGFCCGGTHI
jgi:molecular chaperone DnaJ